MQKGSFRLLIADLKAEQDYEVIIQSKTHSLTSNKEGVIFLKDVTLSSGNSIKIQTK